MDVKHLTQADLGETQERLHQRIQEREKVLQELRKAVESLQVGSPLTPTTREDNCKVSQNYRLALVLCLVYFHWIFLLKLPQLIKLG